VADLLENLEDIHKELAAGILEDLRSGDKNARRDALQLLKQNAITATLSQDDTDKLRSKMASKLDFSALKDKPNVVPMVRRSDDAATA
jgi:hypothetical protein